MKETNHFSPEILWTQEGLQISVQIKLNRVELFLLPVGNDTRLMFGKIHKLHKRKTLNIKVFQQQKHSFNKTKDGCQDENETT